MDDIVGIDLGTTNSEIGVVKNGKPEIISINEKSYIPSCVAVDEHGEVIVGQKAKNQMILNPESTVLSIKRQMGKKTKIVLKEREFTPEEISSIILKELKKGAEEHLGTSVEKAVITVPAYFDDEQRKATKRAGILAGFKVERILNEPTAAAMAYETNIEDKNQNLLVYDLGGGTFDVSVVSIENGVVEVKANHGDTSLGGDDFDGMLIEHIKSEFKNRYNEELGDDPGTQNRLWFAAEKAKVTLTDNPFASVKEEYIKDDKHINIEISRDEYEELINPLIKKTMESVHQALRDSGLLPRDIDNILLAGGASRTPVITRRLKQEFAMEPMQMIDPDLIVGTGASVQAGNIAGHKMDSILVDINSHTFGTRAVGDRSGALSSNIFVPVIPRNTPVPVQKTEVFYTAQDCQEAVKVEIYEGENEEATSNRLVGEFWIEGLSKVPAGNPIVLKLNLDLNGILEVTAEEKLSKLSKTVRLKKDEDNQVFDRENSAEEMPEFIGDDDPQPIEEINSEKEIIKAKGLRKRAEEIRESLDEVDSNEINELLSSLRQAIAAGDTGTIKEVNESLSDMLFYLED